MTADVTLILGADDASRRRRATRSLRRIVRRQPLGVLGLLLVITFFVAAVFAPVLVPYSPTASAFSLLQSPTLHHPFGTDSLGRDVFSRTIAGSQVSLVVAGSVVIIHGVLSTMLGMLSGY